MTNDPHIQAYLEGEKSPALDAYDGGDYKELRCIMCDRPGFRSCSKCDIRYCSTKCQKLDWPSHRLLCGFDTPTKPDDESGPEGEVRYIKALYFPVKEKMPRWVWLYTWDYKDDRKGLVDGRSYLGEDAGPGRFQTAYSLVLGRPLKATMHIQWHAAAFQKGLQQNLSVKMLTQGMAAQDWRGPLIAFTFGTDDSTGKRKGVDMTMTSVRHVVDLLTHYTKRDRMLLTDPKAFIKQFRGPGRVQVVRMAAEGDTSFFRMNCASRALTAMTVPKCHPAFSKQLDMSVLPEALVKLELPCILVSEPEHYYKPAAGGKVPPRTRPGNKYFNTLMVHGAVKLEKPANGVRVNPDGPMILDNSGTAWIARLDFKPLLPEHVEVLVAYFKFKVAPVVARALGVMEADSDIEPVLFSRVEKHNVPQDVDFDGLLNPKSFREFFDNYREQRMTFHPRWKNVPCPYDQV